MALLDAPHHHQHQLCTQHQPQARSAPCQARLNLPFCLGVSQSSHLLLPFRREPRLSPQPLHPHPRLGTHCSPTATSTEAVLSVAPGPATAVSPGNLLERQIPGPPDHRNQKPQGAELLKAAACPPGDSNGQVRATAPQNLAQPPGLFFSAPIARSHLLPATSSVL